MQNWVIQPAQKGLKGEITVPGDKSISHRAVILSSIAKGKSVISNFLNADDCLCTAKAFQSMGIKIDNLGSDKITIYGKELHGLEEPHQVLDMGNSGTGMRLLTGLLSGQKFFSVLTGDEYLSVRPMDRIIQPLSKMGAQIIGRANNKYPPLAVYGAKLQALEYSTPIASAQIKSAVLLAGLYGHGLSSITEPRLSRDHTERMLEYFGVDIQRNGLTVKIKGQQNLINRNVQIPGDISSAAFFIAAGLLVPDSDLLIKNIGINPTRTGLLDALQFMGAKIRWLNKKLKEWEPVSNFRVEYSELKASEFDGAIIPRIIDEIPILSVIATQARGNTVIRNAEELRVKETDRIRALVIELNKLGADVDELKDGLVIHGPTKLKGNIVQSHGDHRIAMSMCIAGLIAEGETIIEDVECIRTSFPNFMVIMEKIK